MKKGQVELGADAEEGESESKVINKIFGLLGGPNTNVASERRNVREKKTFFFFKQLFLGD